MGIFCKGGGYSGDLGEKGGGGKEVVWVGGVGSLAGAGTSCGGGG